MYKKYVFTILLGILLLGPVVQFLLFKFTPVYRLNLVTKLYDDAAWVKGEPKVLIMGSSHARYHIIPKEIAKLNPKYTFNDIVNIGENAASPFEMYTAYMKQIAKFKHVKLAYYTLEPHLLSEKYYLYNTYEKIFLNYAQWKYLEKHNKVQNEYFFPFQTFVDSLHFTIKDRSKTNGFTPLKHKKFNTYAKGKVARQIFQPLSLFPVSDFEISYLGKLKHQIEANGGKFILVETPTYSWQKYYAQEARKYDSQLIVKLNKALGPTPVIGSFWPEDYNLTYKDFKDDTHMAYSGALRFTRMVFQHIDQDRTLETHSLHHTYTYRFISKQNQKTSPTFTPVIITNSLK